jgi:hypothetical protein
MEAQSMNGESTVALGGQDASTSATRGRIGGLSPVKAKIVLFLGLAIVHFAVTWFTVVPGYLLIDEAIYHWTIRDFSATGGFEIRTGYDEYPSIELVHEFFRIHGGRPVSQYPYLFPVLALPFYRLVGFTGLFFLNSLAFVGVAAFCIAAANRLFRDLNLALNAGLILVFATYAWEYSQAAWPHALGMLFVTAAFFLGVCAYYAEGPRKAVIYAAACGLIGGFAPGIRMDCFLIIPCMLLAFLLARPSKMKEMLAMCVGAIPGLGLLAVTNYYKFGVFSPFSYGTGHSGYGQSVPAFMVLVPCVVAAIAWLLSRSSVRDRVNAYCGRFGALFVAGLVLAAAGLAVVVIPSLGKTAYVMLRTFYESVIDIRAIDLAIRLPSMERSSGGGVVYIGSQKKALLQSLPYLSLLLAPVGALIRTGKDFAQLGMLALMPAAVFPLHSYFTHEYGGLCLNYRYFLPIMPFISILAAYALNEVGRQWGRPFRWPVTVAVALATAGVYFYLAVCRSWACLADLIVRVFTAGAYSLGTEWPMVSVTGMEFPMLIVPLIMAVILAFLIIAGLVVSTEGMRPIRGVAWIVIITAMTWSGLVAFGHDYARHHDVRQRSYTTDQEALWRVPPDSLFFSLPYITPGLVERPNIRIAFPGVDQGKDLPNLVAFHLSKGRRVFAAFSPALWNRFSKDLQQCDVIAHFVFPGGTVLGEIVRKRGS